MTMQRHCYYSLIHQGIEALLQERYAASDNAAYHQALHHMTGKSSCFNLSDNELEQLVENLSNEGYLPPARSADCQRGH